MSIHLAAFLQAYGYRFRHVELWAGYETIAGIPVTHSILEIWTEDHWELHDTTFNCCFASVDDFNTILSASQIQEILDLNKEIMPVFDGFDHKPEYDLSDSERLSRYWDYFHEIRYTFEEVFFKSNHVQNM